MQISLYRNSLFFLYDFQFVNNLTSAAEFVLCFNDRISVSTPGHQNVHCAVTTLKFKSKTLHNTQTEGGASSFSEATNLFTFIYDSSV